MFAMIKLDFILRSSWSYLFTDSFTAQSRVCMPIIADLRLYVWSSGECVGVVIEYRTPNREVLGLIPTWDTVFVS